MTDQDPRRQRREPGASYSHLVTTLEKLNNEIPMTTSQAEKMQTAAVLRKPSERALVGYIDQRYNLHELTRRENDIRTDILNKTGQPASDEEIVRRLHYDALAAARKINYVKAEALGVNTSSPASDALETMVMERFAWYAGTKYAHLLHDNPAFVQELLDSGKKLFDENNNRINWYAPKSVMYSSWFLDAAKFRLQMNLRENNEDTADELESANNNLFAQTNDIRRYGVKPAITPALPGSDMDEFLISDPATEAEQLKGTVYGKVYNLMPKPIARFAGATGSFIKSRQEYQEVGDASKGGRMIHLSFDNMVTPGSRVVYGVGLSEKGELLTSSGFPIKQYLEYAGISTKGLETLRAEVLSMYAESVAPAIMAQQMYESDQQIRQQFLGETGEPTPREPSLRRLILARTRILEEQHDEMLRILGEDGDAPPSTDQQTHAAKKVRHAVVGHLRNLAPHQRATPEARKLAWDEERIELPEFGVTYVKRHRRGSREDKSPGHKVIRRHQPGQQI